MIITYLCPVDGSCDPFTGWGAFTEHLYMIHTEGEENDRWETVERLLQMGFTCSPEKTPEPFPVIRHDCAFCHRERTLKDDNHAPDCPYWSFFGGTDE